MENNKTNNIKVTGVTNVTEETQKPRTQGFTQKTLKAWTDQNTRIKQDNLLTEEECRQLDELTIKVRNNWITKNL